MFRIIVVAAAIGFGIASLFAVFDFLGMVPFYFVWVQLLLWPASIATMALDGEPPGSRVVMEWFAALVVINALFYALMALVGIGVMRGMKWLRRMMH